ncbi:hypothetical protein D3C73_1054190 [compost metagenome]
MIFIRSGHIENLVTPLDGIVVSIGIEEPCAFPDDFSAAVRQQAIVASELHILPDSMHHIPADMDLLVAEIGAQRPPGEYIVHVKQRARIIPCILAFPGIECSKVAIIPCFAPRAVQCMDTVHQQVAGRPGITVQEKGQHEHFRVPEHSALVHLPRQSSCRNGHLL